MAEQTEIEGLRAALAEAERVRDWNRDALVRQSAWGNTQETRAEEAEAREARLREALESVLPEAGYPKCDPTCVTVRGAAYDEDPRCDCASGEMRWRFDQARAALAPPEQPTPPSSAEPKEGK